MINAKELYSALLSNEQITALVSADNIMSAYPNKVEIFPCIIFLDENQSDKEYKDNQPGASLNVCQIHIYSKKLDGYTTTSTIALKIAEVFHTDLWHCSQNKEVKDPVLDVEHRVMVFEKSIFNN